MTVEYRIVKKYSGDPDHRYPYKFYAQKRRTILGVKLWWGTIDWWYSEQAAKRNIDNHYLRTNGMDEVIEYNPEGK